jgi:hypothetical protein
MTTRILPVPRALTLCDYQVGYQNGKVDLYGIFHRIRPRDYPHVQTQFCVFAQLAGGLGEIPFFVDIRYAQRDELIHTTETRTLRFPNRDVLVQLAFHIQGCPFSEPGVYIVELFCDNQWVADTVLQLV